MYGLPQLISEVSHTLRAEVEQREHELFATVTRGDVERSTRKSLNDLRHMPKRLVTCLVPISIVVSLEVVDIDQQNRE